MTNAGWQRETRVMDPIAFEPDLLTAIHKHAEERELGAVEASALVSFETVSRRMKRAGLLLRLAGAGHKALTQAVIVTPTRLIWAQRTDDEAAWATSELLTRLDVTDYERSPGFAMIPDHGVEIRGIGAGDGRIGTVFFGFGEGPDSDHARQILKDAVRATHGEGPPVPPAE